MTGRTDPVVETLKDTDLVTKYDEKREVTQKSVLIILLEILMFGQYYRKWGLIKEFYPE